MNPRLYKGVKIHFCNRFIGLDEEIREVESEDPSAVVFEDGMTDFKFVDMIEYDVLGKKKSKIIREDDTIYFLGEFISLDELKSSNTGNKWDTAIFNIEGSNGIGMVTSPDGFHSVMPKDGVMASTLSQIRKNHL